MRTGGIIIIPCGSISLPSILLTTLITFLLVLDFEALSCSRRPAAAATTSSSQQHMHLHSSTTKGGRSTIEKPPPSKTGGAKFMPLPISSIFTVCWYYTSSRNAIATQKLVQEFSKHAAQTLDPKNSNHLLLDLNSHYAVMVALTALQLLVGLCIGLPVHYMLSRSKVGDKIKNEDMGPTSSIPASSTITTMAMCKGDIKIFAVGMLHLLGCFCTNMGFALGSASIVQVIKLLEPIETLCLMALFNVFILKKNHGVTFAKFLSVGTIVLGTSMLLGSKGIAQHLNLQAALFALCSGFAMASRNVIKSKSAFVDIETSKEKLPTSNKNGHASSPFKVAAMNGIVDFSIITAIAAIPAFFGLILVEMKGCSQLDGSISMWMLMSAGQVGKEAIIFHGLYNIASISVLCLISAQSHSLLNVGKRICNVLAAAVIFNEPVGHSGIMGLCIAAIGGLVYSFAGRKSIVGTRNERSRRKTDSGKKWFILLPIILPLVLATHLHTVSFLEVRGPPPPSQKHHDKDSTTVHSFDVLNPVWPLEPPIVQKDCKVMFKNDKMSLCHITPFPNFGDELGPPVVKRILELHFNCSADDLAVSDLHDIYDGGGNNGFLKRAGTKVDTCLMAVGSLWRMLKSGDHIWGTGVAYSDTIKKRCLLGGKRIEKVKNITVYSSRGPNSAKEIGQYCSLNKAQHLNSTTGGGDDVTIEGAGDAGFLVPFIFPEYKVVKDDTNVTAKEKCIIPHAADEKRKRKWKNMSFNTKKLTVDIGWVNMTLALQTCSEVVSSSLHGIILSEAFGIASRRLRLSWSPGDFKFNDFYSSLRGSEPHVVKNIEEAFATISEPLDLNDREEYAKRVLKTFPIHLFHVVGLASAKEISASQ